MNKQRMSIYSLRRSILEGREGKDYIVNAAEDIVEMLVENHLPENTEEWNEAELNAELFDFFGFDLRSRNIRLDDMGRDAVKEALLEAIRKRYEEKEALVTPEMMRLHEKYLLLQVIDAQWKEHLLMLDHLKEGIGLRGYGQRDPLIEYKKESFGLFQEMMERIQDRVIKYLWKLEVAPREESSAPPPRLRVPEMPRQNLTFSAPSKEAPQPVKRTAAKVGRNDPCPCGSGKKYKKCHGTAA